jgi:hypothetical protein
MDEGLRGTHRVSWGTPSWGRADLREMKPDPINAAANSLTCYPAERG